MRIIDCQQLDDKWWAVRRGCPSTSCFDRIITPKGKPSAQAHDYMCELIGDLNDQAPPYFTSQGKPVTKAMQHGLDFEDEARRFLELELNTDIMRPGICLSDCNRWASSPDGLTADATVEIKCVSPKVQVSYLLDGALPDAYMAQVHGQMIVTGRQKAIFLSYCPGLDPFLVRVEPTAFTDSLRVALELFWERFDAAVKKVLRREWAEWRTEHLRSLFTQNAA